jgi:hypothetical protein
MIDFYDKVCTCLAQRNQILNNLYLFFPSLYFVPHTIGSLFYVPGVELRHGEGLPRGGRPRPHNKAVVVTLLFCRASRLSPWIN